MTAQLTSFIGRAWDTSIVPALMDYIRIPNKSPAFDPHWEQHGHMERAVQLLHDWARAHSLPGMHIEIHRLPGRTPVLFIDVPGQVDDCVLLYGHLDKQPEFTGWAEGLAPWTPVLRDGRLYGRGGADDGYALFASLTAIRALEDEHIPHARCVILIEACEESGSYDLEHHIAALDERLGTPSLVVCLDAECGNYDQLWCTTSLRGNLLAELRADVLTEGVHSGLASGIVPSSFRVLRELLARIEDASSGAILLEELNPPIPRERRRQAAAAAAVLGTSVYEKFPMQPGLRPVSNDPLELLLNNTWRSTLSITGAEGLPDFPNAGNVMRPWTALRLSLRLPPTLPSKVAVQALEHALLRDPPQNARVTLQMDAMGGWEAPPVAPWLEASMHRASREYFGKDAMYMGTGGSIPFMGMLGERFPSTQFLVTGLLGPHSNAHGPNEFLHLATGRRLTACVSRVLADHATRDKG